MMAHKSSPSELKNHHEKMMRSIARGDLLLLKDLLTSGVDVKDSRGRTALHVAVNYSTLISPRRRGYLLDPKCYLNLSVAIAKLLIKHGANINTTDEDKESVLHTAIKCQNFDVAKILMEHGADINLTDCYGRNSLFYAVEESCIDLINIMLMRGARTDLVDVFGRTVLHFAAANKNISISNCILESIPHSFYFISKKDLSGKSCLHLAVEECNFPMMKNLIDMGVDIEQEDYNGLTPLLTLCSVRPIDYLKPCSTIQQKECSICLNIHLLINEGANIHHSSRSGSCAIHEAVISDHFCGVRLLLNKGSSINCQLDSGDSPLHLAVANMNFDIINLLLMNGAIVDDRKCKTPILYGLFSEDCSCSIFTDNFEKIFSLLATWDTDLEMYNFDTLSNILRAFIYYNYPINIIEVVMQHLIASVGQTISGISDLVNMWASLWLEVPNFQERNSEFMKCLSLYNLKLGHLFNMEALIVCSFPEHEFSSHCFKKEVQLLKMTLISDAHHWSYYDLLTKNPRVIAMSLFHNHFLELALKSNTWMNNFPIYSPTLRIKLQRIYLRSSLLVAAYAFFNYLHCIMGFPKLSSLCVDEITKYLYSSSLNSMKTAISLES